MQVRIPAVYMRGGTSKGVFFREEHLPSDPAIRDRLILAAYGSPDPGAKQIDGMGGGTSTTSKVAIIGPAQVPGTDVTYFFGQVSISTSSIDYLGNCGNISSAVGPYAIDEGLVQPLEPVTTVRIWQKNTRKVIIAEVPVKNGKHRVDGDFHIDGVPGTGAKIRLRFLDPGGSLTGRLLPTGRATDEVKVPGHGTLVVSIVDAANPVVFVKARDIGLRGTEIGEVDSNPELLTRLQAIRGHAAVLMGLAGTPGAASLAVPKIAFVSPADSYTTVDGRVIRASDIDLVVRIMSMGKLHREFAATGAICTAGAAVIEGTLVNQAIRSFDAHGGEIRIGHPSGMIAVKPVMERDGETYRYVEAIMDRTARRLMQGEVLVPE